MCTGRGYSIDEAFIKVKEGEINDVLAFARLLRMTIKQHTGIPVSIGIARTKTLAKVANHLAKKNPQYNGVFNGLEDNLLPHLATFPVGEIWGIGHNLAGLLISSGIQTAGDLMELPASKVSALLHAPGLKTVQELKEHAAYDLHENYSTKKNIASTRSFGRPITTLKEIDEAVATYTVRAVEKLRSQECLASHVSVYLKTAHHYEKSRDFKTRAALRLPEPTDYTPEFIAHAKIALRHLFKPGQEYKKAGVILSGITNRSERQANLFSTYKPSLEKQRKAVQVVDSINRKQGRGALIFLSEGIEKKWQSKSLKRSPRYTTNWKELPVVK